MHWWPCCTGECIKLHDEFSRHTIGAWDVKSGVWSTSGSTLGEAGNSGAVIIADAVTATEEMQAFVDLKEIAVGDIFQLIVNWVDDDSYFFAELDTSAPATLSLYEHTSGGDSLITSRQLQAGAIGGMGVNKTFWACISDGQFVSNVSGIPGGVSVLWDENTSPNSGGKQAGLGNRANQSVDFDDFKLYEHAVNREDCVACFCACRDATTGEDITYPETLSATITFTGSCTASQISITLTFDRSTSTWAGSGTGCTGPLGWDVTLNCSTDIANIQIGVNRCSSPLIVLKDVSGTCDPIYFAVTHIVAGDDTTCPQCCPRSVPPVEPDGAFVVEVTG